MPISDCQLFASHGNPKCGNRKLEIGNPRYQNSSSSSSSSISSSTMSNSTGSSPTTSRSVAHSSQDTISPLSVSKSTWTSASHSGQVPVGTVSSSPLYVRQGTSPFGRAPLPVSNQINLPATAGICNSLFPEKLAQAPSLFYAESIPANAVRKNKVWKRIVERRYSVK